MIKPIKLSNLSKARKYIAAGFFLITFSVIGQIIPMRQNLNLTYDSITKQIDIQQDIIITNRSNNPINQLKLLNWTQAFQHKNTELAKRFIENYELNFHFTRQKNRGKVLVDSVTVRSLNITENLSNTNEIYTLNLPEPIQPFDTLSIRFYYKLKLPHQKFTGFGMDKQKNILLDNYYFQLPLSDNQLYHHKNIDNYPSTHTDFTIQLNNFPNHKNVYSNLTQNENILSGNLKNPVIVITEKKYISYYIDSLRLVIAPNGINIDKQLATKKLIKIINFLKQNLGKSKNNNLIISEKDLKNFKLYGPELIPSGWVNPFSDELLWEMEMLHQLTRKWMEKTLIDNRKYPWLFYGIPAYLEYHYIQQFYPDLKLLGNLAHYKLVKFYYASQIKMNEKFPWLYLYMARMNIDQKLITTLDSLSNFNRNVAMPYKSALGLIMLQEQIGKNIFNNKLKQFYQSATTKQVADTSFYKLFLTGQNNIDWFYGYVKSRKKYDYKLNKVKHKNDTLIYHIKQKQKASLPLTLFALTNNQIVLKKNIPPIKNDTIIKIPFSQKPEYAGFNYFNNYPEIQFENNYHRLGKSLFKKPLQIRFYQDFDNPLKNQLFINPFFEYNYYNGIILGGQLYNESFLHNNLTYFISPSYATKNNTLTGSFSFSNYHYFDDFKPFAIRYGFSFNYFHYDNDLAYRKYNPYLAVKFRDKNLRIRKESKIVFQFMKIDKDPRQQLSESDKYAVFDINYSGYQVNVIKDFFYKFDLQFSDKFGKTSAMLRYRYLSNRNRQWDFRLYAGAFLYNQTQTDYFSFALDRPTDYLFQHKYYGRSETSGIFYQQFVWAEGGFKTFFNDQFANQFMISQNVNIGVWKWFNIYTDWAWKKSKGKSVKFLYDSGVRVNLVQDYFEVFFPVYSSLGWEINQKDYINRIRLVFTMDINGLFKMVSRGWY
jgi:hypothetical protein